MSRPVKGASRLSVARRDMPQKSLPNSLATCEASIVAGQGLIHYSDRERIATVEPSRLVEDLQGAAAGGAWFLIDSSTGMQGNILVYF